MNWKENEVIENLITILGDDYEVNQGSADWGYFGGNQYCTNEINIKHIYGKDFVYICGVEDQNGPEDKSNPTEDIGYVVIKNTKRSDENLAVAYARCRKYFDTKGVGILSSVSEIF